MQVVKCGMKALRRNMCIQQQTDQPLPVGLKFACKTGACLFGSQFDCELSLFAIRSVFMDNALRGGLVHSAYGVDVSSVDCGLVIGSKRLVEALYRRLDLGRDHTITKVLFRGDAHTLQSGLMVCQNIHPPVFYSNIGDYTTQNRGLQAYLLLRTGLFSQIFFRAGAHTILRIPTQFKEVSPCLFPFAQTLPWRHMRSGSRTRKARELHPSLSGVTEESEEHEGVAVTRIALTTDDAAARLEKRKGRYVTLDAPELSARPLDLFERVSRALSNELSRLMEGLGTCENVLVVGLGNRAITPDSLGPRVVESIYVTRHIKQYMPDALPGPVRAVSAVAPGVLGVTGVETMEIVRGVVEHCKPDLVIAVDALASRRAARWTAKRSACR